MDTTDKLVEALADLKIALEKAQKEVSNDDRKLYKEAVSGTEEVIGFLNCRSDRTEKAYQQLRYFINDSLPHGEGVVLAINKVSRLWLHYKQKQQDRDHER